MKRARRPGREDAPEATGRDLEAADGSPPDTPEAIGEPDSTRHPSVRLEALPGSIAALFRRSRRARLLAAGAGIAAVAFVIGAFVAAPVLIGGAVERYGRQVPGRDASAARVRVHPFTLTAVLEGLSLTDTAAGARLDVERARLDFDFTTLFRRTVVLDELRLEAPRMHVVGGAAADETDEPRGGALTSVADWLRSAIDSRPIEVRRAAVTGGRVEYSDAVGGANRELVLEHVDLRVEDFDSMSSSPAPFTGGWTMPGGGTLRVSGEVTHAPAAARGELEVENLSLAPLGPWLAVRGDAANASGVAGGTAAFTWSAEALQLTHIEAAVEMLRVGGVGGRAPVEADTLIIEGGTLDGLAAAGGGSALRVHVLRLEGLHLDAAVDANAFREEAPLAMIEHPFSDVVSIGESADRAPIVVDRVDVVDGRIGLEDRSVTPPARFALDDVAGTLGRRARNGEAGLVIDLGGNVRRGSTANDGADAGERGRVAIVVEYGDGGVPREIGLKLSDIEAVALSRHFEASADIAVAGGTVDLELDYRRGDGSGDGTARLSTQDLVLAAFDGDAGAHGDGAGTDAAGESSRARGAGDSDDASFDAAFGAGSGPLEPGDPRWALAQALLEDAEGRIGLVLPLGGAGTTGSADTPAAAFATALREAVARITAEPFAVVAALADRAAADTDMPGSAGSRPDDPRFTAVQLTASDLAAIGFEPGAAEPRDAAAAKFEALGAALAQRPLLGLSVAGRADRGLDRNALAAQQIELHVTLATAGPTLVARPRPVDFTSPRAWDVLDEFARERLGAERLETVASYFERDTSGNVVDADKPAFYRTLFDELVANEPIPEAGLIRLGRYRAQAVVDALVRLGIAADRLETADTVLLDSGRVPDAAEQEPAAGSDGTDGGGDAAGVAGPVLVEVPLELRAAKRAAPAGREPPPQSVASRAASGSD